MMYRGWHWMQKSPDEPHSDRCLTEKANVVTSEDIDETIGSDGVDMISKAGTCYGWQTLIYKSRLEPG